MEELEAKLSRQAEDITRLLGSRERVRKRNRELRSQIQDLRSEIQNLDEVLCDRLQTVKALRAELEDCKNQRDRDRMHLRQELEEALDALASYRADEASPKINQSA